MTTACRIRLMVSVSVIAFHVASVPVAAQEVPDGSHLYDTWQFSVAGSLVLFDTSIRVDSEDGSIGTEVDTESDLGLDRTKLQPRGIVRWRPGRRHELEVGYQLARREATRTISEEIEFADTVFTAGAAVRSNMKSDNLFLTYRFALSAEERSQFGIGIGLGAILQNTRLQALAEVSGGGESRSVEYEVDEGVTAPTASIGVYGRFRLSEPLYLETDLRGIYIAIDRFEARLLEPAVGLRWFAWRQFGVEAVWSGQFIRVDIDPAGDGGVGGGLGGRLEYFNQTVRLGAVFAP